MKLTRSTPVIGRPIDPDQERALLDELFAARWVPKAERLEAWSTPVGFIAGAGLLVWMIVRVIIATVMANHGALS